MNLLISLLYAPALLLAIKYFDIKTISTYFIFISLLWLGSNLKSGLKEMIIPLVYLIFAIFAHLLKSTLALKLLPLFISSIITLYIFYSYLNKSSFIFIFLDKIGKKVEQEERDYIQRSTLFWFFASLINLSIHCYILYIDDIILWGFYASIGWYTIFVASGIIQIIHKKLFFGR